MHRISFDDVKFADPNQELLLKAALLSGDEAAVAWRSRRDAADGEADLEPGAFRLLPLVYINLRKLGIDDPAMGKLRGIYRQAWSKNQTLFHAIADVLRYLHNADIRTMLLKGAAMSLRYYQNVGARPMADIDVLVPSRQARQAWRLLLKAGWTTPMPLVEADLEYCHAIQCIHTIHGEFDLHWRPWHGFRTRYEKDFWETALPVKMGHVETLVPDPTDMLFHAVTHGIPWNAVPSIRWIADAVSLINATDHHIDWQKLIQSACKHRYCLRLKLGLGYLRERFHAAIPPEVMSVVENLPISYLEAMETDFMMANQAGRNHSPYHALCANLYEYRRVCGRDGVLAILGFPRFLQWRLQAQSYPELLFNGVRLVLEMILARPFTVRPR